ncbi:MAG: signal peptidase I [Bacilli bacterium]|nr:signal peptidase I [Bacilli bacterium]
MKKNTRKVTEEKTVFHKILEVLSSIFAVVVILVCLGTLVFRMIFKIEVIKIFGYSGLVILTGSMEPNYHPGDVIIIKELADYAVRDVITFHQRNMIVTHRIVEKNGTTFVTQGDANNAPDTPIQLTDIEGKVIKRIGGVGNVILFLQTPAGIMSILVVLISLEVFFAAKRKLAEA